MSAFDIIGIILIVICLVWGFANLSKRRKNEFSYNKEDEDHQIEVEKRKSSGNG